MRLLVIALAVCLASCATVKPGPAPAPSAPIEVRAIVEASGEVGIYSFGEPLLPVYRVSGKFTAVAIAALPPILEIYLEGDAFVVPASGAHVAAVAEGRVRIFRDGAVVGLSGFAQTVAPAAAVPLSALSTPAGA